MEIKYKTFGRTELALLYFPTLTPAAAWRKLHQWLLLQPSLAHFANMPTRTFSPAQVALIFQHIGEP